MLVSPLQRALQTANIVFSPLGVPIIVRSELIESFRYSCDISTSLEEKKKEFSTFDFKHVEGFGEHWEVTKVLS